MNKLRKLRSEFIIENNYIIYMHINKENNKVYIGQTKQRLDKRSKNGYGYKNNKHFWSSIQKYGWNGFEHKVLFENLTQEEASKKRN